MITFISSDNICHSGKEYKEKHFPFTIMLYLLLLLHCFHWDQNNILAPVRHCTAYLSSNGFGEAKGSGGRSQLCSDLQVSGDTLYLSNSECLCNAVQKAETCNWTQIAWKKVNNVRINKKTMIGGQDDVMSDLWRTMSTWRQIVVVMWSSVVSSLTPHLMSTSWNSTPYLSLYSKQI